ncbi:MAG: hypothetical protein ACI92G_001660 [Candidatus Pelagisphaera sp.]
MVAGYVDVETVVFRIVGFSDFEVFGAWSEVPLAYVGSLVSVFFEDFGDRCVSVFEALSPVGNEYWSIGHHFTGNEISDVAASRILASGN